MFSEFLKKENIEFFGEIDISDIIITDENKFQRLGERYFAPESAIIFLIPYYIGNKSTNLSIYAQVPDYHLFAKEMNIRLNSYIAENKIDISAFILADSSPIDERNAAISAGLGACGKNGLIINEKYGSWFFIGAIFLSKRIVPMKPKGISYCENCGKCIKSCPTGAINDPQRKNCLSLITQKKKLSEFEEKLLAEAECKWGCDICQRACPHNQNVPITPISFFKSNVMEKLTFDSINEPKEDFSKRAYSWRGREILRRNINSTDDKK